MVVHDSSRVLDIGGGPDGREWHLSQKRTFKDRWWKQHAAVRVDPIPIRDGRLSAVLTGLSLVVPLRKSHKDRVNPLSAVERQAVRGRSGLGHYG